MFIRKKQSERNYNDRSIEHILGYILAYRGDIIPNRVFMDKEYELNGMIGFDVRRLSDELDCVVLQYGYKYFIEQGESVERLNRILSDVFDRFVKDDVIPKDERQLHYSLMVSRVDEYLAMKSVANIGMRFMEHVTEGQGVVASDTGRYVGPVLKTLEGNIQRRIDAELTV